MEKILFVDSYLPLLDLYVEEFIDDGFDVFVARNGKKALRKYRERSPDLVIMDLHLPDMGGIELLNSLLLLDRHASIIIHEASPQQEDFWTSMVDGEIIKSSDLSQLKSKVLELISKSGKRGKRDRNQSQMELPW